MAIRVCCPNGHLLNVKDEFAGKSGLCPHCHVRVEVPLPSQISEDDILDILGPAKKVPPHPAPQEPEEESVHQDSQHTAADAESGIGLLGSSILRRQKRCPQCAGAVSFAFTICPRCGTPLTDASILPPTSKAP
jgi:hypothetical protein